MAGMAKPSVWQGYESAKVRYHGYMRSLIRWTAGAVISLLPLWTVSAHAGAGLQPICSISLVQWESTDRNRALLGDPALRTLIQAWEAQRGSRLRIEYQAGEQGELWASRMQAWLVAFGVPRSATQLSPGGGDPNALTLSLQGAKAGGGA
jgi:hypothetical protein